MLDLFVFALVFYTSFRVFLAVSGAGVDFEKGFARLKPTLQVEPREKKKGWGLNAGTVSLLASFVFLGYVLGGITAATAMAAVIAAVFLVGKVGRERARRRSISEQLLVAYPVLEAALSCGLPLREAIRQAAESLHPPLGDELLAIWQDTQMGKEFDAAVREFSARAKMPQVSRFGLTLIWGDAIGGQVRRLLERGRQAAQASRELEAFKRQAASYARWSSILVLALPGSSMLLFLYLNPEQFANTVATTSGRLLVTLALGFIVAGFVLLKKITSRIKVRL